MKKAAQFIRNEDGVALIATVGLLLVLVTMSLGFLKMSSYEADSKEVRYDQLRAFWKAEEALSRTRAQINKMKEPDGYKTEMPENEGERFAAKITVSRMDEQEFYAYRIVADVYSNDDPSTILFSLSSVEKPKMVTDYFMLFHYAGDYPDMCPYFDTGDTVNGRLHSNTFVPITGKPTFNGIVTTGDPFPGYKTLPFKRYTPPKKMSHTGEVFIIPTIADKLRAVGENIQLSSEQRAVIELNGDGYILKVRDIHNEQMVRYLSTAALPKSKGSGIFVEGDVEVSGILKGRLTIGSSGDIIITDDVVYSDSDKRSGKPPDDSRNVLGLVAEGNVLVKQKQIAPYIGKGIIINASIMAMDSSFSVLNYRDYWQSMGTMHLWGNIVQYQRGIIGNVRLRGSIEMGYKKDWHYDTRLQTVSPPFMPPLKDEQGNMRFKTIYWKRPD
ncbi:MAG: hypothetical protein JNL74_03130, partial [Fibrobacteres bacterium]|nr:hypothetical protein [Fibrobacterota bacterium]